MSAASGIGMTSLRTRERLVQRLKDQGIRDARVLDRIRNVPRHLFMDEALATRAYEDTALPIGLGQTISQPYVVARMTEAATIGAPKRVLEVGTGCGYQTAVLSPLVEKVYTIERLGPLLDKARERLAALGITNVDFRHGDGYDGWPEEAPFDAIIVTAAPATLPMTLLEQLAENGRIVLPVGPEGSQELLRLTRRGNEYTRERLGFVSFVPLVGGVG
jgi:protein-L-isoaspartate(D-aspartate) O-methyltransferase